jgi:hypothetical protein
VELQDLNNMFYVYAHIRPDTNKVFYIGKGKNERYLSNRCRNRHWKFIVTKNGGTFLSRILRKCETEELAIVLEKQYIRVFRFIFGVGYLTNISEGGIGGKTTEIVWNKGKKASEEHKKNLRKPKSERGRANIRNARLEQFKDPTNHPRWLGFIMTPKGVFRTQKEAAKANGISQSYLHKLVHSRVEGYCYLGKKEQSDDT